MKAADPSIQLTAAAANSREWMLPLLKTAGEYLDYISIHHYWLPLWEKNDMPDYLTCIMLSEARNRPLPGLSGCWKSPDSAAGSRLRMTNGISAAGIIRGSRARRCRTTPIPRSPLVAARAKADIASQYTMADALFSASFFNACLRHADDVGMANIAPIVNTRGPLFVHPKGIVRRTHFHAMAMYANELEPRVGKLDIKADKLTQGGKSVPVVDGIATVDESGKNWSIALVNRHPDKEVACTVKMKDRLVEGEYEALVLTGDSPDALTTSKTPSGLSRGKRHWCSPRAWPTAAPFADDYQAATGEAEWGQALNRPESCPLGLRQFGKCSAIHRQSEPQLQPHSRVSMPSSIPARWQNNSSIASSARSIRSIMVCLPASGTRG